MQIAPVLIGTLMMAATVAVHAIASVRWLGLIGRWHANKKLTERTGYLYWSVLSTATVLLVLQIVEANLWALLYWSLPSHAGLASLSEAVYFSLESFTSLGYGDVILSPEWHLLGPLEAVAGITVFGLTTAMLFAVIQRCWHVSHGRSK